MFRAIKEFISDPFGAAAIFLIVYVICQTFLYHSERLQKENQDHSNNEVIINK